MVYTEQQKKEYQKMRRDRKAAQEKLKDYLRSGHHRLKNQPNDTSALGSCFIGGGLPKSSYRRMSSQARFSTIDVFIRTFTSKVPKARNKNDIPRYKIDISNAKQAAVNKLSRSDREFYNNRITQN